MEVSNVKGASPGVLFPATVAEFEVIQSVDGQIVRIFRVL